MKQAFTNTVKFRYNEPQVIGQKVRYIKDNFKVKPFIETKNRVRISNVSLYPSSLYQLYLINKPITKIFEKKNR